MHRQAMEQTEKARQKHQAACAESKKVGSVVCLVVQHALLRQVHHKGLVSHPAPIVLCMSLLPGPEEAGRLARNVRPCSG